MTELNYIDLFAGAGGLSEGFIRKGFNPIAHVEMNKDACETLKSNDQIIALKPQRIIFNPGTENPALVQLANAAGIETIEACTLVMMGVCIGK